MEGLVLFWRCVHFYKNIYFKTWCEQNSECVLFSLRYVLKIYVQYLSYMYNFTILFPNKLIVFYKTYFLVLHASYYSLYYDASVNRKLVL